jgi:hypothetical protein
MKRLRAHVRINKSLLVVREPMNKIRKLMPRKIEAFIPVLRETYRLIALYQFQRTEKNEIRLRLQLMRATREMQRFKPYLQYKWQHYFGILESQQHFPIGDVICALDLIIHQMHLRAGNKGLLREGAEYDALSPWSKEVKDFLDERRRTEAPTKGYKV